MSTAPKVNKGAVSIGPKAKKKILSMLKKTPIEDQPVMIESGATGGNLASGQAVGITTVNATIVIKTDGDKTSVTVADHSRELGKGVVGMSKTIT